METEKRANLLAKIVGNTWDAKGEAEFIEVEDQCRGVILFTINDDAVNSRMLGDVTVGDLGSVIYLLEQSFGETDLKLAETVAEEIGKLRDNEPDEAGDAGDKSGANE